MDAEILTSDSSGDYGRLARLYALSTDLTTVCDPDQIPQRVIEVLQQALNPVLVTIALYNPGLEKLEYAATLGVPKELQKAGFRSNGTAMSVYRSGVAVFIEDESTYPNLHPVIRTIGFRSFACLPIQYGSKRLGILFINYNERHAFNSDETNILKIFANQAAVALENARLHKNEQRRSRELAALANLSSILAEKMDLSHIIKTVQQELMSILPATRLNMIWLRDPETSRMVLFGSTGIEPQVLNSLPTPVPPTPLTVGQTLPQTLILQGEAATDALVRHLGQPVLDAAAGELGIPLHPGLFTAALIETGGAVVSIIAFLHRQSASEFNTEDRNFFKATVDRTALAIRNFQVYNRIQEAARTDGLTQVYNHMHFVEKLNLVFETAQLQAQPLAFIMLDIDLFKKFNDTYGHPNGDKMLQAVAQAIRENIRQVDFVGRWGGEEFSVALQGAELNVALAAAERIRKAVLTIRINCKDRQELPPPTISLGVASYPNPAVSLDDLIARADTALYRAKAGGRNQVAVG